MKSSHDLMQSLLRSLDRTKESYAWAIQLAEALDQSEPCGACEGRGWRERHQNCNHDTQDRYTRQCYEHVDCKKCHGCGRVLRDRSGELTAERPIDIVRK